MKSDSDRRLNHEKEMTFLMGAGGVAIVQQKKIEEKKKRKKREAFSLN
jgi:hypothetical protein